MPTYEITSPDGQTYEVTAPDGASEADIMSYAQEQFKPKGFAADIGADIQKRSTQAEDIQSAYRAGEISKPEEIFQLAGKAGAGLVGDIGGQLIEEGLGAVKYIDEATGGYGSAGLSNVAGAVGSLPTGMGGTIGEEVPKGLKELGGMYEGFREEHPRAATNIEAAANLAMLGAPVAKRGENIISAGGKIRKSLSKTEISKLSSEDIKETAAKLFQEADKKGGVLKKEFVSDYTKEVAKIRPQTDIGKALRGNDKAAIIQEKMAAFANEPINLQGLKEVDEVLGELAYDTADSFGKLTSEGKKLLDMQTTLRDMVEKADSDMFVGGREAFDTVKEARKYWGASLRLRDIERIVQKSEGAAQPSTVMKNGFRALRDNDKRLRGFTPQEVFAIKKAAKTGATEAFLKTGSSALIPIIAGSSGATAFAMGSPQALLALPAAMGVQRTAKMGVEGLQAAKAANVMDAIKSGVTGVENQKFLPALSELAGATGHATRPIGFANVAQPSLGLSNKAQDIYARKRELRNNK